MLLYYGNSGTPSEQSHVNFGYKYKYRQALYKPLLLSVLKPCNSGPSFNEQAKKEAYCSMEEAITTANCQESPVSGKTPRQFYQKHLTNWNGTGLSQAEYCRRNGLVRHRFGYWKRKFFKEEGQIKFAEFPVSLSEQNFPFTPTLVFNEPNKSNIIKFYMWVFRGGTPEHPGILFEYHPSRSGDVPAAFPNGYQGGVQTDGYSAYSFLDAVQAILHMGCWTHARRKFMDVVKAAGKPKGKKKTGKAGKALSYIRKLYKIEKDAKSIGLTGDALLHERQEKAKPVLDEFKKWLDATVEITPQQSLLGKVVNYALN